MSEEDHAVLSQILRMMQSLDHKFERHIVDETVRLEGMATHIESIEGIVQAFPHTDEGIPDFRGHRRDHDTRMENGKSWGNVIQSVKNKVAENVVNAAMIFALFGYVSWNQAVHEEKQVKIVEDVSVSQQQSAEMLDAVRKLVEENNKTLKKGAK